MFCTFCRILFFIRWFFRLLIFWKFRRRKKVATRKENFEEEGNLIRANQMPKNPTPKAAVARLDQNAAWAPFHSRKTHTGVARGPKHISTLWGRRSAKKNSSCGVKDRVVWRSSIKLRSNLLRLLCGTDVGVVSIATPHTHMQTFLESRKLSDNPFSEGQAFARVWCRDLKGFFLAVFFRGLFLWIFATGLIFLAREEQTHCPAKCALASAEPVWTSEAPPQAPFVVVLKKASLSARNPLLVWMSFHSDSLFPNTLSNRVWTKKLSHMPHKYGQPLQSDPLTLDPPLRWKRKATTALAAATRGATPLGKCSVCSAFHPWSTGPQCNLVTPQMVWVFCVAVAATRYGLPRGCWTNAIASHAVNFFNVLQTLMFSFLCL